jgi:hypothetical protein
MSDPLKPSISLLTKIGSLLVHLDEHESGDGHEFDLQAANQIRVDPEVKAWVTEMDKLALLPKKRKP